MRVSLLKTYGVIPKEMNVAESFLFHLDVPLSERITKMNDSLTIKEIYTSVYEYFIRNILHADDTLASDMLDQRQHFTSVRVMKRNLKLMKSVFGFDNVKVRKILPTYARSIYNDPKISRVVFRVTTFAARQSR